MFKRAENKTCSEYGYIINENLKLEKTTFLTVWNLTFNNDLNTKINKRVARERAVTILSNYNEYSNMSYTQLNKIVYEALN